MRETFLLPVTAVDEKGNESAIRLMAHRIEAIRDEKGKGCTILLASGVVYTVKETMENIERMTKAVGTMVVLK